MKKVVSLVVIIFAVILYSCEKNNPVDNSELISKVMVNGELFKEFSYNESNLMTEEKSRFFYTGHTYNKFGRLVESEFYVDPAVFSSSSFVLEEAMKKTEWVSPENTEKSMTHRFEYDNKGRLLKKFFIRPGSVSSEYLSFEYEDNRISRQNSYYNDVLRGFINFRYNEKGNLLKQDKYLITSDRAQIQTTNEYEYDEMKNPFYALRSLMIPGNYTNPNNIIKETYTLHFEVEASIQKVTVTKTTYDYNRLGYPVRVNGETEYIYR